MTYDDWKCTDPNDQFLGPESVGKALMAFEDGEISLDEMGEILLDNGWEPTEVRLWLSHRMKYPIPVNYFGYGR